MNIPPPGRNVMLAATVGVALTLMSGAGAQPSNDIVEYCRSTAPSYTAMQTCIDSERKARNLQSCLDALGNWPKDVPCPTEWLQMEMARHSVGLGARLSLPPALGYGDWHPHPAVS